MSRLIGSFFYRIKHNWSNGKKGQSLIEILVAVGVGAIILGLGTASVNVVLKSGASAKSYSTATSLIQELMNNVTDLSESSWSNIYNVSPKGATNNFFLIASGTSFRVASGTDYAIADDVKSGLIAQWRMDEGLGTAIWDFSGNNNLGTLVGTPTWQAGSSCKIGDCLSFDGSTKYITVPHNVSLVPSAISILAWIKPSNFTSYMQVVSKSQLSSNYSYQLNTTNAGKLRIDFSANGTTNAPPLISQNSLQSGAWNHVAATWDGTRWKLFINGIEDQNNVLWTGPLYVANTTLDIGRISGSMSQMFNGSIDDVRIYNRALTIDEVKKIYNGNAYSRYMNVENVIREAITNNIVASGGNDDPSTQKITATVEWNSPGNPSGNIKLVKYITRWKSSSGVTTDWSGGPGEEGPVSVDAGSSRFKNASSTMDPFSSPGSLKLKL